MVDIFLPDLDLALQLQNTVINSLMLKSKSENDDYKQLREYFVKNEKLKAKVPEIVRTCRDLGHVRNEVPKVFQYYTQQKDYLYDQFRPLFDEIERDYLPPSTNIISLAIEQYTSNEVYSVWQKALERIETDPEGAITSARTLVERICKHILKENNIENNSMQVTRLYSALANVINIAPNQQSNNALQQVYQGAMNVVYGVGEFRNKEGDSHGLDKKNRPHARHAELAVNMAGSLALFLLRTLNKN